MLADPRLGLDELRARRTLPAQVAARDAASEVQQEGQGTEEQATEAPGNSRPPAPLGGGNADEGTQEPPRQHKQHDDHSLQASDHHSVARDGAPLRPAAIVPAADVWF